MSFKDDIFISYAHIDNRPFADPKGWVDNLFERLGIRLAQLLGREADIWWDDRLQGNTYFVGEIGDRISGSRLLVSIVTPRYVQSDWCKGELKEFYNRARTNFELRNLSRVFKVVKTPVDDERLPEEMRTMNGYVFFEFEDGVKLREFRQEIGANKDQRYWDKLDDLAWDIKKTIDKFREDDLQVRLNAPPKPTPLEKKVYLAPATSDVDVERERIQRELTQRGHYILPDRELPQRRLDIEQIVREHISRCDLSVHFLGGLYESPTANQPNELVVESEPRGSIVELQAEIALERATSNPEFSCLFWMPAGLEPKDVRQRRLIQRLQGMVGPGCEFLQTSVEDLKLRVLEKLTAERPRPAMRAQDAPVTSIYLIHDSQDENEVRPLNDFLFDQGFEVIPSVIDGDDALVSQYHRENLLQCDASLIYYGRGNALWLRSKIWDFQKAPGWGRSRPLKKAIYVSSPVTNEKESFRTRDVPLVIQNFGEFSPATLAPFVQALKNGG